MLAIGLALFGLMIRTIAWLVVQIFKPKLNFREVMAERDQAVSEYMCVCKLLDREEMVGAKGFEPSTSWSRINVRTSRKSI